MKRYCNSKGRIFLALCFLLCTGIFLLILYPDMASSGPYLSSAHGNSTYGVKRTATGFPTDYPQGLCAHCHEQHASIAGAEPAPDSPAGPDYYLRFLSRICGCFLVLEDRQGSDIVQVPKDHSFENRMLFL